MILIGLLVVACTPVTEMPDQVEHDGRTFVPVTLNLSVAPNEIPDQVGDDARTKADYYDPDDPSYNTANAVKTLLILQFEWPDAVQRDAAKLISQQFIQYGDPVSLVASSAKNTVLVVANAWGKAHVAIGTSLGDFLAIENCNLLNSLNDMTGKGIWYTPNGGTDRYMRMNASLELTDGVPLDDGVGDPETIGPFYLKRNCAKVVITVKNTSADPDKVTIDAVQMKNINRKYYYATNISGFEDRYSAEDPLRFNNAEQSFTADQSNSGATQTFTYYVPANMRGAISNSSQASKSLLAPQGATHFVIYAHCNDDVNQQVFYTYYLGANLQNDFNLQPNCKYTYTIELNGKGNPGADGRIEDMGDIVFTKDANCYMLKPPASRDGQTNSRIISIPVRRAAVFWNPSGTNMGVYGAAIVNNTENYLLEESTTWQAWLVWNEVKDANGNPVADSELLEGSVDDGTGRYVVNGQGFTPVINNPNRFIRIKVATGMKGNALVAIKKTSSPTMNDILWSWHLWVTDYDPYVNRSPVMDEYIYGVPGGEIHRYADKAGTEFWSSSTYAKAFMMDRNLGAEVANPGSAVFTTAVGCYYQWGRKDPFPPTGTVGWIAGDGTGEPPEQGTKQNIRYSVHHPDIYLYGSNQWTTYETVAPILGDNTVSKSTWHDPKKSLHDEDPESATYDYCEEKKSIYDPCPYGWQVPLIEAWSNFGTNMSDWITSPAGRYYHPEGDAVQAPKGRIFYPASGARSATGGQTGLQRNGCYWSTTTMNYAAQIRYLAFDATNVNPQGWNARPLGYQVRCIRLDYTRPY